MKQFAALLAVLVVGATAAGVALAWPDTPKATLTHAASEFDDLKAVETSVEDAVISDEGAVIPLESFVTTFVSLDSEGNFNPAVTFLWAKRELDRIHAVVKRIVCRTYRDSPRFQGQKGDRKYLNGQENFAKTTIHVARCNMIRTSFAAAYFRLIGWADASYPAGQELMDQRRRENAPTGGA